MRPIKFRAWHKKLQVMFPDVGVNKGEVLYDTRWYREEEVEIMQFTGLKDKNGKGIYEGDILRKLTGEKIVIHPIIPIQRFYEEHCSPYNDDWMTWCDQDYEVIGNIYENPELLKKRGDR